MDSHWTTTPERHVTTTSSVRSVCGWRNTKRLRLRLGSILWLGNWSCEELFGETWTGARVISDNDMAAGRRKTAETPQEEQLSPP